MFKVKTKRVVKVILSPQPSVSFIFGTLNYKQLLTDDFINLRHSSVEIPMEEIEV